MQRVIYAVSIRPFARLSLTVRANLWALRDAKSNVAGKRGNSDGTGRQARTSVLVSRVLGNMIINTLEASAEGATVRLATRVKPAYITWEIWNNGFIPADVQKRVFQRHFSTKATFGRGLGTFSMKLFGERYLKGKVSFDSSESDGTTFRFRLPRN